MPMACGRAPGEFRWSMRTALRSCLMPLALLATAAVRSPSSSAELELQKLMLHVWGNMSKLDELSLAKHKDQLRPRPHYHDHGFRHHPLGVADVRPMAVPAQCSKIVLLPELAPAVVARRTDCSTPCHCSPCASEAEQPAGADYIEKPMMDLPVQAWLAVLLGIIAITMVLDVTTLDARVGRLPGNMSERGAPNSWCGGSRPTAPRLDELAARWLQDAQF